MNKKQKKFLAHLFGGSCDRILECMSSQYSQGDEQGFKDSYGVNFKEALTAITLLQIKLIK